MRPQISGVPVASCGMWAGVQLEHAHPRGLRVPKWAWDTRGAEPKEQ